MDSYRKEYRKYIENKKSDEIEESSNDFSENPVHERDEQGMEENMLDEDDEAEEEDDELGEDNEPKDDAEMDYLARDNLYDEDDEDDTDDTPDIHHDMRRGRHHDRGNRYAAETLQESGDSAGDHELDQSGWWMSDEDNYAANNSSDSDCAIPVSYNDHDLLIFGHVDSPSSPSTEEEQDLLVMGYAENFLDIRDKDFFNVVSGDDNLLRGVAGGVPANQLEDSLVSPFVESVDDFYGGIETEYL